MVKNFAPWTRAQARALDRAATVRLGMPSLLLMENAAAAVASAVRELAEEIHPSEVLVLCGPGNNGGDGYAAARRLLGETPPVSVLALGMPDPARSPDAALNLEIYSRSGGHVDRIPSPGAFRTRLGAGTPLLVDALFGTGLDRPLEGEALALVAAIASAASPVVAVDLPTGLDADSGAILGAAIPSRVTVTFAAPKRGFRLAEGPSLVGRVVVGDLGVPPWLVAEIARG